jgi:hypothetical protein
MATPEGNASCACTAGPPSPLNPLTLVPATVLMIPSGPIAPHAMVLVVGDIDAAIRTDCDSAGLGKLAASLEFRRR